MSDTIAAIAAPHGKPCGDPIDVSSSGELNSPCGNGPFGHFTPHLRRAHACGNVGSILGVIFYV